MTDEDDHLKNTKPWKEEIANFSDSDHTAKTRAERGPKALVSKSKLEPVREAALIDELRGQTIISVGDSAKDHTPKPASQTGFQN